jgi:hypothetical protein
VSNSDLTPSSPTGASVPYSLIERVVRDETTKALHPVNEQLSAVRLDYEQLAEAKSGVNNMYTSRGDTIDKAAFWGTLLTILATIVGILSYHGWTMSEMNSAYREEMDAKFQTIHTEMQAGFAGIQERLNNEQDKRVLETELIELKIENKSRVFT